MNFKGFTNQECPFAYGRSSLTIPWCHQIAKIGIRPPQDAGLKSVDPSLCQQKLAR